MICLRLNERARRWSPTHCERVRWRLFWEMARAGFGGGRVYDGLRLDIPTDGAPCRIWLDGFDGQAWHQAVFLDRARVVLGRIGALWSDEVKYRPSRVKLRREAA